MIENTRKGREEKERKMIEGKESMKIKKERDNLEGRKKRMNSNFI